MPSLPQTNFNGYVYNPANNPRVNALKTHCIHGHEFSPENTRLKGGHRACKTCEYNNNRRNTLRRLSEDRENFTKILNKNNKAHRDRRKNLIREYLKAHPCVDCGETDFRVLELDHSLGKKSFNIYKRLHCAWAKIEAELAKCEVRCANCHTRRHYEERQH